MVRRNTHQPMADWCALARSEAPRSSMKIAIDRNVPVPAYQQVVDAVSRAVARGDLDRGSRLPSVRTLAVELGLNVNTVARAYRDLERAGVIHTMPGMGTFVADEASGRPTWPSRAAARPGLAAAHRSASAAATAVAPLSTSWRDLLAAAHSLAAADGLSDEEFLDRAAETARRPRTLALVAATSAAEAADLLRALPTDLAAQVAAVPVEELEQRLRRDRAGVVLTTFPGQARVRAVAGGRTPAVVVPLETEYAEATVQALTSLDAEARLALVAAEREAWDQEANDVMKILGRGRWLKMVLLEPSGRGLKERLDAVDCVLAVPRARQEVEQSGGARCVVELTRQLTPRARERLLEAFAAGT